MKTGLGECILRVTRPNGECSQNLVSNPEYIIFIVLALLQVMSDTTFSYAHFVQFEKQKLTVFLFLNDIKVGHEPIPPTPSKTFLGTKVLRLPSFFQYGKEL